METKEMDLFLGLGFVDRILELSGSRIVAQKNLTITEDFLLDHFPNYPVMPGVLMTQALVETAGWWLKHKMDFKVSGIRLKEARNIRYANFLTPGQILTIEVENQSIGEGVAEFQGKGKREESVVLSLKFTVNYDLLKGVASPRDCACYEANERESFHHLYKNSSAL